jgi:hypothetical protein
MLGALPSAWSEEGDQDVEMRDTVQIRRGVPGGPLLRIPPAVVRRGGTIAVENEIEEVFVLIPSPYFTAIVGGQEIEPKDGILAFKVLPGQEVEIRVAANLPGERHTVRLQYAVLACEAGDTADGCEYVEGGSPPWIIIPPVGP